MNPKKLLTFSLTHNAQGQALTEIMAAALDAVDPARAVERHLQRAGQQISVGAQSYSGIRRVVVIGAGKAGTPMLQAATAQLGDMISAGLVVVKEGHLGAEDTHSAQRTAHNVILLEAGHPIPDQRAIVAAEQIATLLQGLTEHDLVLLLLSGGGSALLTWPAPGLTLTDLRSLTASLLRCGATIGEINTLRKHSTRLFGGHLARLAAPAQVAALIVSDVIGSPLDVIASGPSAPDPSTFADAWQVVERYALHAQLPQALAEHLQHGLAGQLEETPKPGIALWERVHNTVIASNRIAAEAACVAARERGFQAELLTTYLEGEAREVGRVFAAIARERALQADGQSRLLIASGETTVTLRAEGLGGRNQELALGAVEGLAGLQHACLIALATDGGDGPTDAAGAVVTGESWQRAQDLGLNIAHSLRNNDAYHFFEALGDLIRPGPTLTNVNDLLFVATHRGYYK